MMQREGRAETESCETETSGLETKGCSVQFCYDAWWFESYEL